MGVLGLEVNRPGFSGGQIGSVEADGVHFASLTVQEGAWLSTCLFGWWGVPALRTVRNWPPSARARTER